MKRSPQPLAHPHYRADIDGLRAIAVLSVVGFHAFPEWVKGGFIGVDIFFVISGFLISSIIFESLQKGGFSFTGFYARRVRRIFPALVVVLLVCFVFGWFALLADEYKQLGKHMAGGAGFIANLLQWGESGYFNNAAETKPLLHLWSLGIEEQFYIAWPLLLWCAWKLRVNLLAATALLAGASFLLNAYGLHADAVATFYSPQTRAWELLCGSLLAWPPGRPRGTCDPLGGQDGHEVPNLGASSRVPHAALLHNLQSATGSALIVLGLYQLTKNSPFPGYWALLPVLGTVLVIRAGPQAWINRVLLSQPLLVAVGLISFPLYLWHWPLLSFARIMQSETLGRDFRLALVALSVLLAWLTFLLVERPLRGGGHAKTKTLLLLGLMGGCGYLGYDGYARDGLPFRKPLAKVQQRTALGQNFPHQPYHNGACDSLFPQFKDFHFCLLSKDAPPELLMVGDSHSNMYYKSLASQLGGKAVMNLGATSCLPFASHTSASCANGKKMLLEFIAGNASIKTVYLAGYWSYLAAGTFKVDDGNYRLPQDLTAEQAQDFQQDGTRWLAALVKTGKKVVLMDDIPDLDFNIRSCFSSRPYQLYNATRQVCAMDQAPYEERMKPYRAALAALTRQFPHLPVYDPKHLFCDGRRCWGARDGQAWYFNSDHVTILGANQVVADLLAAHPPD